MIDNQKEIIMSKKSKLLIKFGQKVKEERHKRGLTQEEFASKASVHRTYIGMIERAEKNITLENMKKIADALDLKLSQLLIDL